MSAGQTGEVAACAGGCVCALFCEKLSVFSVCSIHKTLKTPQYKFFSIKPQLQFDKSVKEFVNINSCYSYTIYVFIIQTLGNSKTSTLYSLHPQGQTSLWLLLIRI